MDAETSMLGKNLFRCKVLSSKLLSLFPVCCLFAKYVMLLGICTGHCTSHRLM